MTEKVSIILLVIATLPVSRSQIQFDGFMKFLEEMGDLKVRLRNVQQTGRALVARADVLEAAILKMNRTMGNSMGIVTSAVDSTFDLKNRLQKISGVVNTTKQNMTKLHQLSNVTNLARKQLDQLAEKKSIFINNLVGKITSLKSTVKGLQNITENLKADANKTEDLYEGMVNITDRVEHMACESGFGYEKTTFPSSTKIRFPSPFATSPNVLYGMTLLDRVHIFTDPNSYNVYHYHRYYPLNVNITEDNIDERGLSMSMKKSSSMTLKELEFNWMACLI